jgi:hypothetical protein
MNNTTVKNRIMSFLISRAGPLSIICRSTRCSACLILIMPAKRETPSVAGIINPTGSDGYSKFFFGPGKFSFPYTNP